MSCRSNAAGKPASRPSALQRSSLALPQRNALLLFMAAASSLALPAAVVSVKNASGGERSRAQSSGSSSAHAELAKPPPLRRPAAPAADGGKLVLPNARLSARPSDASGGVRPPGSVESTAARAAPQKDNSSCTSCQPVSRGRLDELQAQLKVSGELIANLTAEMSQARSEVQRLTRAFSASRCAS